MNIRLQFKLIHITALTLVPLRCGSHDVGTGIFDEGHLTPFKLSGLNAFLINLLYLWSREVYPAGITRKCQIERRFTVSTEKKGLHYGFLFIPDIIFCQQYIIGPEWRALCYYSQRFLSESSHSPSVQSIFHGDSISTDAQLMPIERIRSLIYEKCIKSE